MEGFGVFSILDQTTELRIETTFGLDQIQKLQFETESIAAILYQNQKLQNETLDQIQCA